MIWSLDNKFLSADYAACGWQDHGLQLTLSRREGMAVLAIIVWVCQYRFMIKARVVFDLDGTLVDSAAGIRHTANLVLAQEKREPLSLELTVSFIGNGISTFIERMSAARDIPASEHSRLFAQYNEHDQQSEFVNQTYPHVVETLQALKDDGYVLGLCTNKLTDATHVMLKKLDLEHFFAAIVCGDTLPVRKPDPQMLHKAFDALPAAHNVYVGDSEVDAETAQRAKVDFLFFTEGYRKTPVEEVPHTFKFSDYRKLAAMVDKVLAL